MIGGKKSKTSTKNIVDKLKGDLDGYKTPKIKPININTAPANTGFLNAKKIKSKSGAA